MVAYAPPRQDTLSEIIKQSYEFLELEHFYYFFNVLRITLRHSANELGRTVLEHTLSFAHGDGMINVFCETMVSSLPPRLLDSRADQQQAPQALMTEKTKHLYNHIATWTYCNNCSKVVTQLVFISDDTWNYSFGKFLEVYFYNREAIINSLEHGCCCPAQTLATLYFGCERLAARFTYEKVCPFGVFIRRSLPFDESFHRNNTLHHLEKINNISSALFLRFDNHIEKVSREARQLLGSAANKPKHLQQVSSTATDSRQTVEARHNPSVKINGII